MNVGLTVGDFSRMTHLSVKTLHHYHQVGLLEPAQIDSRNGYRYYSIDQIPAAQVIRRLRDLDMPIPDVKAVLAAPDSTSRNALIAGHLDRLETELAQTRAAVSSLRNLLTHPPAPASVEHRTVPATPAVAIRQVIDRHDILAWWQNALDELHATVRTENLTQTGPSGGLFTSGLYQNDHGEATVFIPVHNAVRTVGRVEPFLVPPAELAIITHHGPLAGVDITYGELGSYATRHEISVDGPLREYYRRDAHNSADPDTWETDIGWPIFRADRDH
ncbi:MAG: MerR family DNA-binding transcriptional regulator [Nocardia sp.]|uniref:MerR family transcriptional regulator n=1 Tax=Nocardia sp. TaxID=1821 RepID=UPI0026261366|nr:MerR family transcriptional regulator [Nocardia sp.]MCU1648841.1 MerR family DNA-binding transcriptional regulator [Nocardia sp.]